MHISCVDVIMCMLIILHKKTFPRIGLNESPRSLSELDCHYQSVAVTSRSMTRSTVSVVCTVTTSPVLGSNTGTVLRSTFSERTRSRSATTFSLGWLTTISLDHLRFRLWPEVTLADWMNYIHHISPTWYHWYSIKYNVRAVPSFHLQCDNKNWARGISWNV